MKTISSELQQFLNAGATTMAYCWRITRVDSTVLGFTEHDRDLTFLGTTFTAATGFTSSAIQSELGLSIDNLEVNGALSSDAITENDIDAGRYDNADIELYWVNFNNVSQRIIIARGSIGEVRRFKTAFGAEMRGLSHHMQQRTGRAYQRYCDADLGDSRCQVNLASFTTTGSVVSVLDSRTISVNLANFNTDSYFAFGVLTFNAGENNSIALDVKRHSINPTIIEFWVPPLITIRNLDTFSISAGCGKDINTCRDKFNNHVNFQGFPDIPGNDVLTSISTRN